MAKYFKLIFDTIHADSNQNSDAEIVENFKKQSSSGGFQMDPSTSKSVGTGYPWYIIPPPAKFPNLPAYNPSFFGIHKTFDVLFDDIKENVHFTTKKEDTGCEGLYGLFYYMQLPDVEIGFDIDVGAFIAGGLSCTLLGLYLDDIYYPRKLMTWWPTKWFFHFLEEGMYLKRSTRWLMNATVIFFKVLYRALYGGVTHTFSRMLYYWVRRLCLGVQEVPYYPLFDDTFAALLSGYLWTGYTVETERHTAYDRIIAIGWTAVFTGAVEYCLFQYFVKDPPPGLFRWLFGGAYYGPGIWRYLKVGVKPGEFV